MSSSSVALLEIVASQCCLPFHSYLREVGGDGSVLGGVELEVHLLEGARPARHFFGPVPLLVHAVLMKILLFKPSGFYSLCMGS